MERNKKKTQTINMAGRIKIRGGNPKGSTKKPSVDAGAELALTLKKPGPVIVRREDSHGGEKRDNTGKSEDMGGLHAPLRVIIEEVKQKPKWLWAIAKRQVREQHLFQYVPGGENPVVAKWLGWPAQVSKEGGQTMLTETPAGNWREKNREGKKPKGLVIIITEERPPVGGVGKKYGFRPWVEGGRKF